MEENKLPHSIAGAVISWLMFIIAWTVGHLTVIAGVLAIVASIYSVLASRETIKLRKKQQKDLDDL